MPKAEITWNGEARTNCIGKQRFTKGRTEIITDPDLIRYCQISKGFSVHLLVSPPVTDAEALPRGTKTVVEDKEPEVVASELAIEIEEEPESLPRPSKTYRSKK